MYSYLIPRLLAGIDVRVATEDRNPGGANAMEAMGFMVGIVCMALDVLKAFVPVFVAVSLLGMTGGQLVPVLVAPVLGHAFTPFLSFKGGKAVAASFGALLGVAFISKAVVILIITMLVFKFIIIITPDSTKVITAFAAAALAVLALEPLKEIKIAMGLISAVVCLKHMLNPNKSQLGMSLGPFAIKLGKK